MRNFLSLGTVKACTKPSHLSLKPYLNQQFAWKFLLVAGMHQSRRRGYAHPNEIRSRNLSEVLERGAPMVLAEWQGSIGAKLSRPDHHQSSGERRSAGSKLRTHEGRTLCAAILA